MNDIHYFKWIDIHIENKNEHQDGFLLPGNTCSSNVSKPGFVGQSTAAYWQIYPIIADAIERDVDGVYIDVQDIELPKVILPDKKPRTKIDPGYAPIST